MISCGCLEDRVAGCLDRRYHMSQISNNLVHMFQECLRELSVWSRKVIIFLQNPVSFSYAQMTVEQSNIHCHFGVFRH